MVDAPGERTGPLTILTGPLYHLIKLYLVSSIYGLGISRYHNSYINKLDDF